MVKKEDAVTQEMVSQRKCREEGFHTMPAGLCSLVRHTFAALHHRNQGSLHRGLQRVDIDRSLTLLVAGEDEESSGHKPFPGEDEAFAPLQGDLGGPLEPLNSRKINSKLLRTTRKALKVAETPSKPLRPLKNS